MIKLTIIFFLILMVLLLKRSEPYISYGNYSNDTNDYGTIVPYNKNYKYEGIKMEIHPIQMDGILTFLKLKFPEYTNVRNLNEPLVNNSDFFYNETKTWLINLINLGSCEMSEQDIKQIQSLQEQSDIDSNRKFLKIQNMNDFTIIHDNIQSKMSSANGNIVSFIMKLVIYREPADIAFSIDAHIINDTQINRYYINKLELIGMIFEDKIPLLKEQNQEQEDCSMRDSYDCNTLPSITNEYQQIQQRLIRENNLRQNELNEQELYQCYGKNSQNKFACESFELINEENSRFYRKEPLGIWAKSRCTNNEECPYYRANLNYPNNRGGCVNGRCEMPLNVSRISPTIADPRTKPFCHNCDRSGTCSGTECLQCCDAQRRNSSMRSPDYAFNNDFSERMRYASSFRTQNLSPYELRL